MAEFDPASHEQFVRDLYDERYAALGNYALFDELIDMHHDGLCSFDEAIDQYKHDLEVGNGAT